MDIAGGLVKGASKGEDWATSFCPTSATQTLSFTLSDASMMKNVIHVEGGTDPARDVDIIDLELIMADMEMVERRIEKANKNAKGDKKYLHRGRGVQRDFLEHLNEGKSVRSYGCDPDDMELIATSDLLTIKPVIYAANMDEDGIADYENNAYYKQLCDIAAKEGAEVLPYLREARS